VGSQVSTPLLEHWVAPGEQTPEHAPLAHTDDVHVAPSTQLPFESQV
jgi:hypothetical protein